MDRKISLDILKFLITFMVVAIHTSFLGELDKEIQFFIVDGIFRIAVPIYFIINGFYLYDIKSSSVLLKWVKRIGLLYLFWSILYAFYWVDSDTNIVIAIYKVVFGHYHLWYLSALLVAGILLFQLKNIKSKHIIALCALLYGIGLIMQYLGNYHTFENPVDQIINQHFIYRNALFFALPWLGIGFLIAKINHFPSKYTLVFLIFIGILLLWVETSINLRKNAIEGFDFLLSLIILCPAIFIFSLTINTKGNTRRLSEIATGIFLVHPFVIYSIMPYINSGTQLTLLVFTTSYLLSFLLTIINKRYKFLL